MNSNERFVEFNPHSEKGIQAISLAKKAIKSIRNDITCKNATPGCKKCGKKHPPFHPHSSIERESKSKDLTKKVIEIICGNISTKKDISKCNISSKNHCSTHPCGGESGEQVRASTTTMARAEEKELSEARLTEPHGVSLKTAACQCCDSKGIPAIYLVKIDSGQLLCPDCLKSLRDTASRKTVPHRERSLKCTERSG